MSMSLEYTQTEEDSRGNEHKITYMIADAHCIPADTEEGWQPHPSFGRVYLKGDPRQVNIFHKDWKHGASPSLHRLHGEIVNTIINHFHNPHA